MNAPSSALRRGRFVARTIAFLLVAAGAVQVWVTAQSSAGGPGFLPGFLGVAAGVGLWLRARWARWLALGACFAAIVAACVVPVLSFLLRPHDGPDAALGANLWLSALALMLGAIGYTGLGYLRSEGGRREFFGPPAGEELLPDEPSSAVLWSALVWVAALGIFAANRTEGSSVPATMRPPQQQIASTREAPAFVPPPAPEYDAPNPDERLPDLIPLGLCRTTDGLAMIAVVVGNIGTAKGNAQVWLTARLGRDLREISGVMPFTPWPKAVGKAPLPITGTTTRDLPAAGFQLSVDLDPRQLIAELDETNNSATFDITRGADGKDALPDCTLIDVRVEKWGTTKK